jgi:hypothetical protein
MVRSLTSDGGAAVAATIGAGVMSFRRAQAPPSAWGNEMAYFWGAFIVLVVAGALVVYLIRRIVVQPFAGWGTHDEP